MKERSSFMSAWAWRGKVRLQPVDRIPQRTSHTQSPHLFSLMKNQSELQSTAANVFRSQQLYSCLRQLFEKVMSVRFMSAVKNVKTQISHSFVSKIPWSMWSVKGIFELRICHCYHFHGWPDRIFVSLLDWHGLDLHSAEDYSVLLLQHVKETKATDGRINTHGCVW